MLTPRLDIDDDVVTLVTRIFDPGVEGQVAALVVQIDDDVGLVRTLGVADPFATGKIRPRDGCCSRARPRTLGFLDPASPQRDEVVAVPSQREIGRDVLERSLELGERVGSLEQLVEEDLRRGRIDDGRVAGLGRDEPPDKVLDRLDAVRADHHTLVEFCPAAGLERG